MVQDEIKYPAIPSVLYSLPRLSQIGVTVEDAKENDQYTVNMCHSVNKWYSNIRMKQKLKCILY